MERPSRLQPSLSALGVQSHQPSANAWISSCSPGNTNSNTRVSLRFRLLLKGGVRDHVWPSVNQEELRDANA